MKHLIRNRCAFTATEPEQLRGMLTRAFSDAAAGNAVAEQALEVARTWHNSEENGKILRAIVEKAIH